MLVHFTGSNSTESADRLRDASDNPLAASVLAVYIGMFLLSSTFFIARIVSRIGICRSWRNDDYLLTTAWLLTLALTVVGGMYRDSVIVDLQGWSTNILLTAKVNYFINCLYPTIATLTKLSIALNYLRVFWPSIRDRYAMIGCGVFLAICYIPMEVLAVFPCTPIRSMWAFEPREGMHCLDTRIYIYFAAAANITSDLWIITVVLARTVAVRIPWRQKMILLIVVFTGFLVIMTTILRVLYFSGPLDSGGALSVQVYNFQIWTAVELNLSIACACAPTILPLLRRYFSWSWLCFRPESASTNDSNGSGGNLEERDCSRDKPESHLRTTMSTWLAGRPRLAEKGSESRSTTSKDTAWLAESGNPGA